MALAVGDVAGHGIKAASVMGQLRNALRAYVFDGYPPAEAMHRLDGLLAASVEGVYATAVHVALDPRSGELRWSNAGHPPPVVVDEAGARFLEPAHELLLGGASPAYVEHRDVLPPGGTLWLYTDGLVEARGSGLAPGLHHLTAVAVATANRPLSESCDEVIDRLFASRPREDDVCLLAVRRPGG
jgi:serine phosphatase RsbU (regulator of sigma subunit)